MRNLIRAGAAAALLASATLVGGIVGGGHAFAAGNCPATSAGNSDYCTAVSSVAISGNTIALTLNNLQYSDFQGRTLNGGLQSTTSSGTNSVVVTDQSGSGHGWHLTVQATPLACTTADTGCGTNHTLDYTKELMSTAGIDTANTTCATQCRGAATAGSGGQIDDGVHAATVASAALNNGMGQYNVRLGALTTNLTADMYAAAYHSTVTVTLTQGP